MERRDFLKLASMAGLGVVAAGSLSRDAAAAGPYSGPLFVHVHASGGWDPTSLCDPKGAMSAEEQQSREAMNRSYLNADIGSAGNIKYAPVGGNAEFFKKHYSRLLVVNGIDTATNSHDAGVRNTWSGTLREGKPGFAALVAGVHGGALPMGFISNGGYDTTANLVAVTRVPDTGLLQRLAYPNMIDPSNSENREQYHTDATMKRILEARQARHGLKLEQQRLPHVKQAMSTLFTSRVGQNELKQLIQFLPEEFERESLRRQAQVALAAYRAGICVSANLTIGGFDTHGNHDDSHIPRLTQICDGVDFLLTAAEEQGIADRIVIVVGSDFGRTPGYNDGNGKDHWNITSMMMVGAGIPGNRVIGATDERHNPLEVDPVTLEPKQGGVRITPGHVHKALRKLAGIADDPLVQRFPLSEEEDLPLFG
ncbi:DUF1501 domain-containing protein [Sorangium sp. So ce1078]|uniref:DUF1501 domain-containing protein n=1 Tax=Sorangium sp. So ce1078 TaxID=3133329 RepID=UPI003F6275FC